MKNMIRLCVCSVAGGMSGCTEPTEKAAPGVESHKVAEQALEPGKAKMHVKNGRHHGGFHDPKAHEKQWNSPERDLWQHPEEIIAALALKPGATVADIGAGTGYMVAHLSAAVGKEGTVIAIDVEQAMIMYLEEHRKHLGPARIVLRKVNSESPELQNDSVDGVIILNTWHHINGREAYAQRVYAALKPGGKFVVVDSEVEATCGPPKEMRLEAGHVVQELKAGGFRAELARESMPEHYMIVGHKD